MQGVFITEQPSAGEGIPLAVKDLFDTAGVRTTYGSAVFADHVPIETAEAVARLEAAGYRSVGKANLHEFAWGITSENDHYGWVPNPVAPGRIPGGSSGGNAAALVAGLADAALGTDSGGSVRIPAACCGVVGFKPTFGLVPISGCFPLAPSFDHAGPMARDVAGCERMMEALAEGFTVDPPPDLDEVVVGIVWLDEADPLVRARVEAAVAHFPAARPVELPFAGDTQDEFLREAAEVHASLWADHEDASGPNVAAKIRRALSVEDSAVEQARRARERHRERFAALMEDVDLLPHADPRHRRAARRHRRSRAPRAPDPAHLSLQPGRRSRIGAALRIGRRRPPGFRPARRPPGRRRVRARLWPCARVGARGLNGGGAARARTRARSACRRRRSGRRRPGRASRARAARARARRGGRARARAGARRRARPRRRSGASRRRPARCVAAERRSTPGQQDAVLRARRLTATGPIASLMPQRPTMPRAIWVRFWMSDSAPVVVSP